LRSNITYGMAWVDAGFYGTGAQGGCAIYSCDSQKINIWDPLAQAWRPSIQAPGLTGCYHGVLAFSSVYQCLVFGGTTREPSGCWKMETSGAVTTMLPCPVWYGCSIGQLCNDPSTGKFLVFQRTGFYELNPAGTGTWTLLTGTRARPVGVNTNDNLTGNGAPAVALAPISKYGVIAFISPSNNPSVNLHIYKHG
jgi:hypothetical protein